MATFIVKTTPSNQPEICIEVVTVSFSPKEAEESFRTYLREKHPTLTLDDLQIQCDLKPPNL